MSSIDPWSRICMSFRQSSRLSAKTLQAAVVGLADPLVAVRIMPSSSPNMTLRMGCIARDVRLSFLAANMNALPAHRSKGVGRWP